MAATLSNRAHGFHGGDPNAAGTDNSWRQQQQQQNNNDNSNNNNNNSNNNDGNANHDITTRPSARKTRTESALSWWKRCQQRRTQQRRLVDAPPEDPASAAWAFFRRTEIPFVDESLRCHPQYNNQLPAVEIRDNDNRGNTGKTRTLLTLAARFVVSTRPSLFLRTNKERNHHDDTTNAAQELPRVILMDSTLDITPTRLAYAVSSMMLRQQQCNDDSETSASVSVATLERDIQGCLDRIHVAHVDDISGWVPVLESIRADLLEQEPDFPTLLLWDGFLSEPSDVGSRMEVTRQLARLLKDCSVGLIYTASSAMWNHTFNVRHLESKEQGFGLPDTGLSGPVSQTIRLERDETPERRHDFVATVSGNNTKVVYSLSSAGVLR